MNAARPFRIAFALFAALAAVRVRAKSIDDFVGVYTPPADEAAPLRAPVEGMPVNTSSVSAIGYAYDRFCGLADLTAGDFADLPDQRDKSFPFASASTRREIAEGDDLTVRKFDNVVAAAGAFLASGDPVAAAAGDWLTTPLYCPAAADYAGNLFKAGEYDKPPQGVIEGAPCRGGVSVPCLGAFGGLAPHMAYVGNAFAQAVGGTFEADGGLDCSLDDRFAGDEIFSGGALARGSDGAPLSVEPWRKLARLANGMNGWAAILDEPPAKFQEEHTEKTRTVTVSVERSGGGNDVEVKFSTDESARGPDVSVATAPSRSCALTRTAGSVPTDEDGNGEVVVTGLTTAYYREIFDENWSLVSTQRGDGYTMRTYRCKSRFEKISGEGGTTWTDGLGAWTVGTSECVETIPTALVEQTDARLLTDAQIPYYGTGRLLVGGRATTRRNGEAKETVRHLVSASDISPADGYRPVDAVLIDGYATDSVDEAEIDRKRALYMMDNIRKAASVTYDRPAPSAPPAGYRYKYEIDYTGGGSATNEYWGGECDCWVKQTYEDTCTCGSTGLRCETCAGYGCTCCSVNPPGAEKGDDEDDDGDDGWEDGHGGDNNDGDGDVGGGGGSGVRAVYARAEARVRIPLPTTNAYLYVRTATIPKCLVFARINSTGGAAAGGGGTVGPMTPDEDEPCDIYVDGNATGGDGSKGNPFGSLDDAVNAAKPSDADAQSRAARSSSAETGGDSTNAIKRIGIRRGTYAMPALFNRSPHYEPVYPVELVGLDAGVVLRKTMRYATGAYDEDGQPLTKLRNLTIDCRAANRSHRMSVLSLDGCRITGIVTSNYSVVEASLLRGCVFEGLTFVASAHNGTDVAPVVYGSDVSNCVFDVTVENPDITTLAEVSAFRDCLVRGGRYAALHSFYNYADPSPSHRFDRCTFVLDDLMSQTKADKDSLAGADELWRLYMADCIVFADGFTNAPPTVVDNAVTNRAAADAVLNPVTWRPRAQWREWRKKGFRSVP